MSAATPDPTGAKKRDADPLYYSYSVVPDGAGGLKLTAHGDLDDDGVLSTFESLCDASCHCSPTHVVNELE